MTTQASNKLKYLLANKVIDFANDSFKIILMKSGFVFNRATHHAYADVSASELATAYGYTADTKTLASVTVTEDDTNNWTLVTWAAAVWNASGGAIGPSPGAIIYDDTPTTPTANPIVGYIDFGGDQTQVDGGAATISNISVKVG